MNIFGILLFIIIVPQSIKDIFKIYSKDELIIYGIDYVSRILEISIVLLVPLLRVRAIAAISRPQQISDLVIGPILTAGAILALGYVLTAPLNRVFEETIFFSYPKIESSWLYIFDLTIGLALVAFSEELIFRGVLPAALSTFISNRVIVAIIASIVFAAVHWSKGVGSIITAFFYGIVFMIAYYRANSIVSPAIAHYMVNLVIYL